MEQVLEREELVKKYLLGELREKEEEEVEVRLLADEEYLDELLLVEGELTDDFVFGALPTHERPRVEEHFLAAPGRRLDLLYAVALRRYISEQEDWIASETAGARSSAAVGSPRSVPRLPGLVERLQRYFSTHAGALKRHLLRPFVKRKTKPSGALLAEAQKNRAMLGSLIESDWMGLHLLALLNSSPRSRRDLAAELGAGEAVIAPALARLVECGLVEERKRVFFCTGPGTKILLKIETASGVKITP